MLAIVYLGGGHVCQTTVDIFKYQKGLTMTAERYRKPPKC